MADPDVRPDEPSPVTIPVIFAGYVVGFVLSTLVTVVLLSTVDTPDGETAAFADLPFASLLFIQLGLWGGMLAVPSLVARTTGRRLLPDDAFDVELLLGAKAFALGLAVQLLVIPLVYLPVLMLLDDADLSEPAREITDRASGAGNVIVLVILVVIGAPLVEEIFFRGLLQPRLVDRFGVVGGIGLTSVLFAASHIQLLQFPALVIIGAAVGWLAHRTGRVGPAIIAHVGFNLVTVVVLLAQG